MTAFDDLAATYDSTLNPLLALEERVLTPILPDVRGLIVADVGSGTGRWLHRMRGAKTIALDSSVEMLKHGPGLSVVADALKVPLRDESADLILCSFTLGYAPECFTELARITRGTLVVTDVHPERDWARMAPYQRYSLADLHHPGLTRTHFFEPHLGEQERPLFAAKPHLYEAACEHPAIFVAIWTR